LSFPDFLFGPPRRLFSPCFWLATCGPSLTRLFYKCSFSTFLPRASFFQSKSLFFLPQSPLGLSGQNGPPLTELFSSSLTVFPAQIGYSPHTTSPRFSTRLIIFCVVFSFFCSLYEYIFPLYNTNCSGTDSDVLFPTHLVASCRFRLSQTLCLRSPCGSVPPRWDFSSFCPPPLPFFSKNIPILVCSLPFWSVAFSVIHLAPLPLPVSFPLFSY